MSKVGILGGTFDPIHYGHLILGQTVKEDFDLSKIIFMPLGKPPHKDELSVSSTFHRVNMVTFATQDNFGFEVSEMESNRSGYTYTVDTLDGLLNLYQRNTNLFYIIGADVLLDIDTWRNLNRVFSMCEFIVVCRGIFDKNAVAKKIDYLKSRFSANINIANMRLIDISSTEVREKVQKGKSIKYLVPESVGRYIYQNNLYKIINKKGNGGF